MKIKIKEEITVDVVEEIYEDDPVYYRETFKADEILDVDVFDTQDTVWGIQFGDGSVCYLPLESFEVCFASFTVKSGAISFASKNEAAKNLKSVCKELGLDKAEVIL